DHPQTCVSWDDARTYCASVGKQLPTEAQWEYAARGGKKQLKWPWGNATPTDASACLKQLAHTCAVKSYPAGAFGLYDMAGNVEEWVADWYKESYPQRAGKDPLGPSNGLGRVVRGGSSRNFDAWSLRGTTRSSRLPSRRENDVGFRCATTR